MKQLQDVYNLDKTYTLKGGLEMRTNIVIDDELIAEAMQLSGARTKREAVEHSLRLLVQLKRQEQLRGSRGKLKWVGDLEAMRRD